MRRQQTGRSRQLAAGRTPRAGSDRSRPAGALKIQRMNFQAFVRTRRISLSIGHSAPLSITGFRDGSILIRFVKHKGLCSAGRQLPPYRFYEVQFEEDGDKLLHFTCRERDRAATPLLISPSMSLTAFLRLNSRQPRKRIQNNMLWMTCNGSSMREARQRLHSCVIVVL